MLFFLREDLFHQTAGSRVLFPEVTNDLPIGFDRDTLGDQILLDEFHQCVTVSELRVAAAQDSFGAPVRNSTELLDASGNLISMYLLFVRVLQELASHGLRLDAIGQIVVALIAQRAYDFGSERLIEDLNRDLQVALIVGSDCPLQDVLAGSFADVMNVGQEFFFAHERTGMQISS